MILVVEAAWKAKVLNALTANLDSTFNSRVLSLIMDNAYLKLLLNPYKQKFTFKQNLLHPNPPYQADKAHNLNPMIIFMMLLKEAMN